jgi:hypothetical protein
VWTDLEVVETGVLRGLAFYRLFPRLNRNLSDIFRPFVQLTNGSSLFQSRLRVRLFSALLEMDDAETVNDLGKISIDDAPEELLSLLMQLRGRTDFEFAIREYTNAQTPQRRNAALGAIGATQTRVDDAFQMLLGGVKTHEITTLLAALVANSFAQGRILEWFKANAEELDETFGSGSQMQTVVEAVFSTCKSAVDLEDLMSFLDGRSWAPLAAIGRANELETARVKVRAIEW